MALALALAFDAWKLKRNGFEVSAFVIEGVPYKLGMPKVAFFHTHTRIDFNLKV